MPPQTRDLQAEPAQFLQISGATRDGELEVRHWLLEVRDGISHAASELTELLDRQRGDRFRAGKLGQATADLWQLDQEAS